MRQKWLQLRIAPQQIKFILSINKNLSRFQNETSLYLFSIREMYNELKKYIYLSQSM